jgi:hypothetical protein
MEHELKDHLRRCATAYAEIRGIALPTVGRLAAGDWRFFDRLADGERSFTARKYDEVTSWFSDNWPASASWPDGVPRPVVRQGAAA